MPLRYKSGALDSISCVKVFCTASWKENFLPSRSKSFEAKSVSKEELQALKN